MYDNKKNPSRVFEIYECLFELKQRDKFAVEFYGELEGLIDELEMHQHDVSDAATLRGSVLNIGYQGNVECRNRMSDFGFQRYFGAI